MIFSVCLSIASLVASYGTDRFQAYFHAMKTVKETVRCGTSLKFASEQDTIGHEEQDMEQVPQEENTVREKTPHTAHDDEGDNSSRFANLRFRTKVKARRRPKRSVR